jgi:hypothetical protein
VTDVAYLCHNCGSMHEVESIRENLILDLRTAGSYELSGQRGLLGPRARFLRWHMTWGLARALWPGYRIIHAGPWRRRLVQRPQATAPDRPVPRRAAASGSDAHAGNPVRPVPVPDGPVSASILPPRSPAKAMISHPEAASALG